MLYFNPKPNFQILAKYWCFPTPAEVIQNQYANGYPIIIDWYNTEDKVALIEKEFKGVLLKYNLVDHYDNLLYLCLGKIQEIEAIQYELDFQYSQKKRAKELAELLLGFSQKTKSHNTLLFKAYLGTYKVGDQLLIEWIGKTILNAVKEGKMPVSDFPYDIVNLYFDNEDGKLLLNLDKLKLGASKSIVSPSRKVKALHADFCLYIYKYLVNETNIKTNPNVLVSDKQLNLYFDLLVLFEYINPNDIESEPKDYMSALLRNRLNKLNRSNKGNK